MADENFQTPYVHLKYLCILSCSYIRFFLLISNQVTEVETVSDLGDAGQNKMAGNGGGLGKKMRAISLTMKKKMGKKYIKALSEDTVNMLKNL